MAAEDIVYFLWPAFIPFILSLILFWRVENKNWALGTLVFAAFLLRLLMIQVDPYLHTWDEAFHALVAKNMMEHPFTPMLRTDPILEYDYREWSNNHIWLHKQPLFLWQMALSMQLFGVNEFAVRFPSVVMGALTVFFIYKINYFWSKNELLAYASAFFFSLTYYQLELTTGAAAVDHNDVVFSFYVMGSIWLLTLYLKQNSWAWALSIGLMAGLAILNKWLTGFLVFGGWGLAILMDQKLRTKLRAYVQIAVAFVLTCVVFLPWQFYIHWRFPKESQWEQEYSQRHFFEVIEGHGGTWGYHIETLDDNYGLSVMILFFVGLILLGIYRKYWKRGGAFFAMGIVCYLFFSIAATKMPAFTMPVAYFVLGLAALPFAVLELRFKQHQKSKLIKGGLLLIIGAIGYVNLNLFKVISWRKDNYKRTPSISNAELFRSVNLKKELQGIDIVFNMNHEEQAKLMFYQDVAAYSKYPSVKEIDSLLQKGIGVAVFRQQGQEVLPDYIVKNKTITILNTPLEYYSGGY